MARAGTTTQVLRKVHEGEAILTYTLDLRSMDKDGWQQLKLAAVVAFAKREMETGGKLREIGVLRRRNRCGPAANEVLIKIGPRDDVVDFNKSW